MATYCENCGQPAAEDDLICWQCGQRLVVAIKGRDNGRLRDEWSRRVPTGAIGVYAGVTLAVLLAFSLATGALKRWPLLQLNVSDAPLPGWQPFADAALRYTLDLPEEWRVVDEADPRQAGALAAALADSRYRRGSAPFGDVEDFAIVMVATAPPQIEAGPIEAFVVVGQSQLLSQLEASQAIDYAQTTEVTVIDASLVDDFERSHVAFLLQNDAAEPKLRCKQSLSLGAGQTSYLVAACAEVDHYGAYAGMMDTALDSFQRLAP
jgi:hypothetical protein